MAGVDEKKSKQPFFTTSPCLLCLFVIAFSTLRKTARNYTNPFSPHQNKKQHFCWICLVFLMAFSVPDSRKKNQGKTGTIKVTNHVTLRKKKCNVAGVISFSQLLTCAALWLVLTALFLLFFFCIKKAQYPIFVVQTCRFGGERNRPLICIPTHTQREPRHALKQPSVQKPNAFVPQNSSKLFLLTWAKQSHPFRSAK